MSAEDPISFLAQPPMSTSLNAGRLQPFHYARRLRATDGQSVEGQIDDLLLTGAVVDRSGSTRACWQNHNQSRMQAIVRSAW